MAKMVEERVKINEYLRYMDDGRSFMPPFKHGWRWRSDKLVYTRTWEKSDLDEGLSGEEVTRRIVEASMNEVFPFLRFTTEVGEGEERWLPTLDLRIRVEEDNLVSFSYFEKPTVTNVMVQQRSAMEENARIQILSNDMRRRLSNTDPRQGREEYTRVVDMFAKKLLTSGYDKTQVRRIILGGIRGLERKKERAKKEGRPLYRTSQESAPGRVKKKLLGKSTWFRKRKANNSEEPDQTGSRSCAETTRTNRQERRKRMKDGKEETPRTRTVLFVENTPGGALAKQLREIMERIQKMLGYRVKIVERAGTPLKLLFPLGELGVADKCEREDCTTCVQPGEEEKRPRCKKRRIYVQYVTLELRRGMPS